MTKNMLKMEKKEGTVFVAYLASSSCFSLAFLLAFLPWVLANRALASDSISNSSVDIEKEETQLDNSLKTVTVLHNGKHGVFEMT